MSNNKMKVYLIYIFIVFSIVSCVSVDINSVKYNELGIEYEHLDGKIFSAECSSSDWGYKTVKTKCIKEISKFVFKHNYKYFSVITSDANSASSSYGSCSNSNCYFGTTDSIYIECIFIFLNL